jgi:hypothetical protein
MIYNRVFWLSVFLKFAVVSSQNTRNVTFFELKDYHGMENTFQVDIDEKACIYTFGLQVRSAILPENVICKVSEYSSKFVHGENRII